MKNVIPTYMERMQKPHLGFINFDVVMSDPYLAKLKVTEAFWFNSSFRMELKQKLKMDMFFRQKFKRYFPDIYNEIQNSYEKKGKSLK